MGDWARTFSSIPYYPIIMAALRGTCKPKVKACRFQLKCYYYGTMKNNESEKIEAIVRLMTQIAEDAHYEAADGEPEPYTFELLNEQYYNQIKQILKR